METKNTPMADLLSELTGTENNSKQNKEVIKHELVENTPFIITGNDETGYFLRLGDYRLTEWKKTHDDVIDTLYGEQWNIITNLICAILDTEKRLQEIKKQ